MSNKIFLTQSDAKALLGLTNDAAIWNAPKHAMLREIAEALTEALAATQSVAKSHEIIFSVRPK